MTAVERSLAPADLATFLSGHADLLEQGGYLTPVRLPAPDALPAGLASAARQPAGVRWEADTDAAALSWHIEVTAAPGPDRMPAPFDVVVNGRLTARPRVHGHGLLHTGPLGGGRKRVQIWLPQYGTVRLGGLALADASLVDPVPAGPRWVAYGSSITHCTGADGPSATWPALVASANGWDLRCLGFAGECHLDPAVARFVRDAPADLVTLCVGVNVHGAASFSRRSFAPALAGFVGTIRDGHPATPIVLMTPIHAPRRERECNAVGLTLAEVRAEIEAVAAALQGGDPALHLVDGPAVFGPAEAALMADGLHPGPTGYRLIAERLAPLLARYGPAR